MGITKVTITVGSVDPAVRPRKFKTQEECEVLVDTGATYTSLPANLLKKLGILEERKVSLTLADGRTIERPLGYAWIGIQGMIVQTPVLFAENGDPPLLGVIALEDANFSADPVTRQLVKRQSYIQY